MAYVATSLVVSDNNYLGLSLVADLGLQTENTPLFVQTVKQVF